MLATVHPRQPDLGPELQELWLAALADAGIGEDEALLIPVGAAEDSRGNGACFWRRHEELDADGLPDEVRPFLDDLNADESLGAYRLSLATDRTSEGAAALLRHELEHARQFDAHGVRLQDLHDIALDVLRVRAAQLRGGAALYQWIPMEFDANAAGAMFARARFGDERIDSLLRANDPDRAAMLSLVGPQQISALPDRMVLFLATMPDLCEQAAPAGTRASFRRMLNSAWAGAGDAWERLTDGALLETSEI